MPEKSTNGALIMLFKSTFGPFSIHTAITRHLLESLLWDIYNGVLRLPFLISGITNSAIAILIAHLYTEMRFILVHGLVNFVPAVP